jgi:ubiquinone/menaquinone biosynthesis C-methylase UbiE
MSSQRYKDIVQHYESCFINHGDNHLGVDWPNKEDAEKRYAIMLQLIRNPLEKQSLLDFGCGLSHLYQYILNKNLVNIEYSGLDMSPYFCEISRQKYPANKYICADVLQSPETLCEFDYVVMNGVFTEKRNLSYAEMLYYFKDIVRVAFPKVRKGLAFNVMSKAVDWERDDLFHVPIDPLIDFLATEISRHIVIRNDYGLYEYTVYVYRDPFYG